MLASLAPIIAALVLTVVALTPLSPATASAALDRTPVQSRVQPNTNARFQRSLPNPQRIQQRTIAHTDPVRAQGTAAAANNLLYWGGPVMQTANNSVPIFWLPATLQDGASAPADPAYATLIQQYFQDVGGSGLYGVNTQYYQTTNGFTEYIINASGLLAAVIDNSPYPPAGPGCFLNGPNCLDDQQIRDEISKVITAQSLPTDNSTMYYVFSAPHESTCISQSDCFKSDTGLAADTSFRFCAYHSFMSINGQYAIYANMPYGATAYNNGCTSRSTFPNNRDADIEISTTSHEQMEATTDPFLIAWFDANGQENGDKCAYVYGALPYAGGLANQRWNAHAYVVQQEWSNQSSTCTSGTQITPPASPTYARAWWGDRWIDVEFGTPADGGSPITGYTVNINPGNAKFTIPASQTRLLIQGLANLTAYNVSVVATNVQGSSAATAANSATPTSGLKTFSTNWSASEYARLVQTANFLGTTPASAQLTSVYTVGYLLGIVAPPSITPIPPPAVGGTITVDTNYTSADQSPLQTVMRQFALNPTESQYFCAQLLGYLLALGGH